MEPFDVWWTSTSTRRRHRCARCRLRRTGEVGQPSPVQGPRTTGRRVARSGTPSKRSTTVTPETRSPAVALTSPARWSSARVRPPTARSSPAHHNPPIRPPRRAPPGTKRAWCGPAPPARVRAQSSTNSTPTRSGPYPRRRQGQTEDPDPRSGRSRQTRRCPTRPVRHRAGPRRLIAQDDNLELSEEQVSKIKFSLLEFLPTRTCEVSVGPGASIVVPDQDRSLEDLTPGLLWQLEAIVGCALLAN